MTNIYSPTHTPLVPSRRSLSFKRSFERSRQSDTTPTSAEWTRLHLIMGVCASSAACWFESVPMMLRERYQMALEQQVAGGTIGDYPLLHDPIEDDPQWRDAFAEVEEMLAFDFNLDEIVVEPNFCFLLWNEKARFLREEFGLEWFSPAQMNPFVRFA